VNALLSRIFQVAQALFAVHLDTAKKEISRDATRIFTSVVIFLLAFVFLTVTFLLVDVGAVLVLHDVARLEWWSALLVVIGVNAALATVFAVIGRARMKKPVLVETRALAKKTSTILRGT
jgi:hypothetical protein